ncbi:hypothetical protein V5O48_011084 [Marasmius crinis-equi]|uniref:Oxidoreductase AflY n=1 Tax=Marasmius crinis-equi TaxID=585013 RepID=A0ABR3F6J1_9AGAR
MSTTFELFPTPTLISTPNCPIPFPGTSPDSTEALKAVLRDNHERYHVFFNDKGFHNHLAHRAIAVWALGGSKDVIRKTFEVDSKIQRPRFDSPEKITRDNFGEHLGDEKYYDSYVDYFLQCLRNKSAVDVLEEHVFSPSMNVHSGGGPGEDLQMLCRFVDGLVHPMIHVGYGIEFGLPGILAEGLSQTALHGAFLSRVVPPSLFASNPSDDSQDISIGTGTASLHAFSVLARIMKDDTIRLPAVPDTYREALGYIMENHSSIILKLIAEWSQFDASDAKLLQQKVKELMWTNALLYGVSGYCSGKVDGTFNADFFVMHLVTSSIFLPTLVLSLKPASGKLLLRAYFAVSLATWIARGKSKLDVAGFFSSPMPVMNLSGSGSPTGNPWYGIIDHSLEHWDDHLVKTQRALAHCASLYGSKKAGGESFSGIELEGAEAIDGTLFLRAAALTAIRVVEHEGKAECWDRVGYFD